MKGSAVDDSAQVLFVLELFANRYCYWDKFTWRCEWRKVVQTKVHWQWRSRRFLIAAIGCSTKQSRMFRPFSVIAYVFNRLANANWFRCLQTNCYRSVIIYIQSLTNTHAETVASQQQSSIGTNRNGTESLFSQNKNKTRCGRQRQVGEWGNHSDYFKQL